MSQTLCILGRQGAIALAELESLYGHEAVTPITSGAAIVDMDPQDFAFNRLGGTMKAGKVLHEFNTTNWYDIQKYLVRTIPDHMQYVPEGRLTLGLSVYGLDIQSRAIEATALELKKVIKKTGHPVRIVPNKATELSTAQVLHNKLFTSNGWELFFVRVGKKVIMAQTTHIQDIDAYTARDQARPKRDAKVGMLPPKLAQIIINMALGNTGWTETIEQELLDPFCGTGVILQEALLMGYEVYGTDIEPRLVQYSKENLDWLNETTPLNKYAIKTQGKTLQETGVFTRPPRLEVGDATSFTWLPTPITIACETYLGRPFSFPPDTATLQQVMSDVNTIHKKFLQNVARQTKPGFRMAIAVPAWFINGQFKHLSSLDHLEELGYTRLSFKHAVNDKLIYHREGQIVGRELVTLIRK
ncbi:MAG: hypothetical protein M3Q79_04810 [bacterium]|nr:hypothetical protein [bacterium]